MSLRIAQVAPLLESVPPTLYGGTERVVSYLTEEQVRAGFDVTLYASADSVTAGRLRPQSPRALRLDGQRPDPLADHLVMLDQVFREADQYDVIHLHTDYLHLPLASRCATPTITTLHGRLDLARIRRIFRTFRALPFVSISVAQRAPMPWLNWTGTVHHGLPPDLHTFVPSPEPYLAFLGRISPEKGVDRAIEVAIRVEMPLRIGAKVDPMDREYFEAAIRPLLDHPLVEYLGEIGGVDKDALLGNATALLFPISWPEPFGLVMIESLACGTPVIAFPCGSVPEVLRDGETGLLVRSVEAAASAVRDVGTLDRRRCRAEFEARFSARRMADDYLTLYRRLTEDPDEGRRFHSDRKRARSAFRTSPVRPAG
jgi:glycosyltransferase involved in cell wall biosynthesis